MKQKSLYLKTVFWLSSVFMVLGLAACRHNSEEKIDFMAERVSSKLGFSEQQELLWQQIMTDLKFIRAAMEAEHSSSREMIMAELKSEQLDENKIYSALEQHQQAMSEGLQTLLPQLSQLHASLSAEQKETLIAYIEKTRDRGHHFH